ncbi:MAG TPA: GNVR domain-containing protein [Acidobacteriaceae bacterium]|nr:GNVR domain-containing protein [Acidobacteriaceae bacterium]
MLGHRSLNVEDYLTILKRRWWIVCIPAIILPIVCVAFTYTIVPQYQSQSLILINQQKVSTDVVKPLDIGGLQSRLALITAQIESRSTLEPIINKYNLYAAQHLSVDARVDLIRTKNLQIAPIQSQIANGLPGFRILFTADDPHTAQQVCAEIAGLYTQQNLQAREEATRGTTNFLQAELDAERQKLNDMGQKVAEFKSRNLGALPDDESGSMATLNALSSRLDADNAQITQLQQSKPVLVAMLSQATQPITAATTGAHLQQADELQLAKMQADLADLQSRYSDDYPDVKSMKRQIADLRAQIAKEAAAPAPAQATAPPPSRADSVDVIRLRAQIQAIDQQIADKTREQAQIQAQMRSYEGRIQASPMVEQQYIELTRDYATEQGIYNGLLAKMGQSQMATDVENRQEGEGFTVLDAASLPIDPTYPKQSIFAMGGLGGGLALGVLIVALLEYRDTALRTERDIWAFTQLPTLAVVAWSPDVAQDSARKPGFFKRLFSRKAPKELLAG